MLYFTLYRVKCYAALNRTAFHPSTSSILRSCFLPLLLLIQPPAQAQIIPDNTLGPESSIVLPQGAQSLITGGAVRGNNLFHSFQQFNIDAGQAVRFNPTTTITNIFSRVTGTTPSNIQGTLGVLGNANLFLLNPNGILFGPNAQLNLAGSFTASTANSFQLGAQTFSATTPNPAPLLTISAPIGHNLGPNPGLIENRSTANGQGLVISPFQSISFIGGDIQFPGGRIFALDGQVNLSSIGEIALSNQAAINVVSQLGNPNSQLQLAAEKITLAGQSGLSSFNRTIAPGPNIRLNAQKLSVMDGSQIVSINENQGNGGNILANIPEQITITNATSDNRIGNPSSIVTTTLGSGRGGNIQLQTSEFFTEYNGFVLSQTGALSTGDGGDIRLQASRSVIGRYTSPTNNFGGGIQVDTRGTGTTGNLTIQTPLLDLSGQHNLISVSWITGQGGTIRVEADDIRLDGSTTLQPRLKSGIRSWTWGSGNSGDIQITTQNLTLEAGAQINSVIELRRDSALSGAILIDPSLRLLLGRPDDLRGDAGNVTIVADTTLIDGFNPFEPAEPSQISSITFGNSNAGDVSLTSRELTILNGGGIGSSNLLFISGQVIPVSPGLGRGGNLTVNSDEITVSGSNPITQLSSLIGTQSGGFGDAGNTTINTNRLRVVDGGLVNSGTLTSGNGGALTINARDSITVDGINPNGQPSTIGTFALAPSEALQRAFSLPDIPQGETKQLTISTDRLIVSNGGKISAEHQGIGDASNLNIQARQLRLNGGRLITETLTGSGGDIDLNIQDGLLLRNQSQITATARSATGNSGNININAGLIFAIPTENSDIIANAVGGSGGNINLRTGSLLGLTFEPQLTAQSDITASSQIGFAGTVDINLFKAGPNPSLRVLPTTLKPQQQISTVCNSLAQSRFILSGRGGISIDPRQQIIAVSPLQDWRNNASSSSRQFIPSQSPPIIEAQTWHKNAQGQVTLVAGASTTAYAQPTCSQLSENRP